MRLQLQLTPNTQPVPYDHLHQLTGALHKWLGRNDIHDGLSLYSFGWLRGGESRNASLRFPKGANWNISFFDDEKARQLLKGILDQPELGFGMQIYEIREVAPPPFQAQHYFLTDGSSIVIRQKRPDGSRAYLLWDDPATDQALTQSFQRKLIAAGFSGADLGVTVSFDRTYQTARTRKIAIKGTNHRGSECPVIVEGTPDALHFAWTVGLGELTGSGFGALR
ncbi:CRISPR-associated endoribonuclease Cas6 [Spirosoma foliorum]|uniref:CRISPR-associated endoribonuclease Cas6 n=1 Tax=Spirosoma foliorum TaxID=2710596 RepID=A0A7G5H6J2_9BACT|nr:CRISPR-associated endoribonuclease Cas6 [Spirosoma foliorum]QMW06734.1 CRISPR-associated endoribonuclease Cas6 [Spirosoma foliorum]